MLHRENGWYLITDGQKDSLANSPMVTVKDFAAIELVSDDYGLRVISGKVNKQYLQPIITQYFIDNKSEIWLLFLIAHSKR